MPGGPGAPAPGAGVLDLPVLNAADVPKLYMAFKDKLDGTYWYNSDHHTFPRYHFRGSQCNRIAAGWGTRMFPHIPKEQQAQENRRRLEIDPA